jgi:hypothetical protein
MHAQTLSDAIPTEVREDAVDSTDNSIDSLARFAAGLAGELPKEQQPKNISRPKCLLSSSLRLADGVGPAVALDEYCAKLLVVTLSIDDVVERTGLTVSVWGSPDGANWGTKPLVAFRQRQYCGVYSVLLNLAQHPDARHLRVQWSMARWGKGERAPQFGFQVFLEESGARISSAVA